MPNALMAPLQSSTTPPQPAQNPDRQPGPMGAAPASPVGAAAAGSPDQETIEQAHKHVNVLINGLLSLTNKPRGHLTKQDVFSEAADMIAKGAFPDATAKSQLVAEMAKMPDDEQGIRKALGGFLLSAASNQTKLHAAYGPPGGSNA